MITYGRRGFGQSSQPTIGYDYDTFAADLAALLEQLDLTDVALAGVSRAAIVTDRYAYFEDFINNFYDVDQLAPARISDRAGRAAFLPRATTGRTKAPSIEAGRIRTRR